MPARQPAHAFISYARSDGEEFATALRHRLEREQPEITVWQDRARLEGGVGWWSQIVEALDQVSFLVIVITPASLASETTVKEWRYARQQGVCVYPVKATAFEKMSHALLPSWIRKAHIFDLEKEWDTFIHHLKSPCRSTRVPFMAPDMRPDFVARPVEFDRIVALLLDPMQQDPVAITTALHGSGGFGKTTLATAVCHDPRIIEAFNDGVLWATLGQTPNIQQELTKIYAAVTGERPGFVDAADAELHLATKLEGKNCLIVVDDAWSANHLRHFVRLGKDSARLVTTRQFDIAIEAARVDVDEMRASEALQLLTAGIVYRQADRPRLVALAARLGEWPLLLQLSASVLRQRLQHGDGLPSAVEYVNRALDKRGITAFDKERATSRDEGVAATLSISLDLLAANDRQRCLELAVFPEDTDIPLDAIRSLWDVDDFDTEELTFRLANHALITFDSKSGTIRIHDVIRSYFAEQLADVPALHGALIERWGDPMRLRSHYAWRWFCYHLQLAGDGPRLERLLIDFDWIRAKLAATDMNALIGDYEYTAEQPGAQLVQSALRLSSDVVAKHPDQLIVHLYGRLLTHASVVPTLIHQLLERTAPTWLQPLTPALAQAGGHLLATLLMDDTSRPSRISVSSDGGWVVALGGNARVWNVHKHTSQVLTIRSDGFVTSSFFSPDGQLVLLGTSEGVVELRSPVDGGMLGLLADAAKHVSVSALSSSLSGDIIVAGFADGLVHAWDIERGDVSRSYKGHTSAITYVAISPDGRSVTSCAEDGSVLVWDFATRKVSRSLDCREQGIQLRIAGPTGTWMVSQPFDTVLRLWDLDTLVPINWSLDDFIDPVIAISVSQDGRWIVSSDGMSIQTWDVISGTVTSRLTGHADPVTTVGVAARGEYLATAAHGELRLWRLDDTRKGDNREGHPGEVWGVAVSANGCWTVTASKGTILVWDHHARTLVRRLSYRGIGGRIAAIDPRGAWALVQTARGDYDAVDLQTGNPLDLDLGRIRANRFHVVPGIDGSWVLVRPHPNECPYDAAEIDEWLRRDHLAARLWNTQTGELRLLDGISPWAIGIDSRNERLFAVDGGGITSRDLATGQGIESWPFAHAQPRRHTWLSLDCNRIASFTDSVLHVMDLQSRRETTLNDANSSSTATMSPDGSLAMTAGLQATLWDLDRRAILATFVSDAAATEVAIAPDNRTFVVGDQSGQVHFLQLAGARDTP